MQFAGSGSERAPAFESFLSAAEEAAGDGCCRRSCPSSRGRSTCYCISSAQRGGRHRHPGRANRRAVPRIPRLPARTQSRRRRRIPVDGRDARFIKSRMLLPPDAVTDDEQGIDPRAELIARLLEYERFKQAAGDLGRPLLAAMSLRRRRRTRRAAVRRSRFRQSACSSSSRPFATCSPPPARRASSCTRWSRDDHRARADDRADGSPSRRSRSTSSCCAAKRALPRHGRSS